MTDGDLAASIEAARVDPRRRFGRFVLLSELGRGGMGVVYKAWDDRLRRVVALKTILAGGDGSADAVARFRREAEAVARLRHPNLVSVFDAGEVDGRHWLAMDFIQGTTLARRLAGEGPKLSLTRAVEALGDVARAVQHAHEQGVVHRDLKPQNVILDAHDRAFVLDFGLAAIRGETARITKSGATLGTPAYMPPEQAGEAGVIDERSDVYSLGATLYHVLTGRPPFEGATELNVIAKVVNQDPVPPGTINPRVAGDLETIALKCLEKEPARRYATAGDVARELERHLAGEPIEARPLGSGARLLRALRRRKLITLSVTAIVTTILVSVVFAARARDAAARATRDKLVAEARAQATARWDEFAASRTSSAVTRDAVDRRLALGLRALQAAGRYRAITASEEARASALRAALALADDASSAEQWSLAAAAIDEAGELGLETSLLGTARAKLREQRERVQKEHAEIVRSQLAAARSRASTYSHEDALLDIVRLSEPQTVELLVKALEPIAATLENTLRDVLLAGARAAEGEAPIEGLEGELARISRLPPARRLELSSPILDQAIDRCVRRKAPARKEVVGSRLAFLELVAREQSSRLGIGAVAEARLACDALGRLRFREAIPALQRYLAAEADSRRASFAAAALAWLDTSDPTIEAARDHRFGAVGAFWSNVIGALEQAGLRARSARTDTTVASSESAGRKLERGEVVEAEAEFTRVLQSTPGDARAHLGRASARLRRGDLSSALDDANRAVELAPENADAWALRANIRHDMGDLEAAQADADRAVAIAPRSSRPWVKRAHIRLARGDRDGALSDIDRAIDIDPSIAFSWALRGEVKYALRDHDGAIGDCTRAIELLPTFASPYAVRGYSKGTGKKDVEGGLADLDRALELDPAYAEAYLYRGVLHGMRKDYGASLGDLDRAIELEPKLVTAYKNRALARYYSKDTRGAIADLERFLAIDPRHPEAPAVRDMLDELRKR